MRSKFGICLTIWLLLGLLVVTTSQAATDSEVQDYTRTEWTAVNGAPVGIASMAQTADGWLWFGTADGLYRFDGIRFTRYPLPSRLGFIRDRINQVSAAPNGDLYISYYAEGLSVLHPDGRFEQIPSPTLARNSIDQIAIDSDGSVWAIAGSIQHFKDGRWRQVEQGAEWNASRGASLLMDSRGQIWAGNTKGAWRLDRSSGRFIKVSDEGGELLLAPDGSMWQIKARDSVRMLTGPDSQRTVIPRPLRSTRAVFDEESIVWLLDCPAPACRVKPGQSRTGGDSAHLGDIFRLSGREAQSILQDREGNIWIATENGVDRFRRNRLLESGLPGSGVKYSLATDGSGNMWAADIAGGALWKLTANRPPSAVERSRVTLVANGRQGAVFIGDSRSIEKIDQAGGQMISLPPGPDGKPIEHHMVGILDDGKQLWTATMEARLIAWRDGKWLPSSAFNLPAKIFQSGPAGVGQLWLATGDGTLVFYDNEELTTYDIRDLGIASTLFPAGEPIVSGANGSGVFKNGKLHMLRGATPDALRNISGLAIMANGDRWLNGGAGLLQVSAADWKRSVNDPSQPLQYKLFGALDGYPGRAVIESRWPSAMSPDGRNLWVLATGGVVRVDTGALRRNQAVPHPAILGVTTDQAFYPASGPLRLQAGTGQFRIDFTAPLLRAPEAARFEYRLEGIDEKWLDAGTRRSSSYTNVAAGDYVFRLRVSNEDGVASAGEATLRVTVEPTIFESPWFRAAAAAALALLAFSLYRWRILHLTRRLAERLEIRTAERERIAMELHDTVLQSMHGVIIHAENAAELIEDQPAAKDRLNKAIRHANQVIMEGRDRVQSLRHGSEDELIDMYDVLVELEGAGVSIRVEQNSVSRGLHLVIKDELYVIGREALRNAIRHAQASEIVLALTYGAKEFQLEVRDNGVGIPADILAAGGRAGHMGLTTMRSRVQQIGGKWAIESQPSSTLVRVTIAARLAYRMNP